jgi:glucose/arabinose dehydrogenase
MQPASPRRRFVLLVIAQLAVVFASPAPAAVTWNKVYSGFASPIEITNAHDGGQRLFVVQQTGKILIIKGGVVLAAPFIDLGGASGVTAGSGEQGLLGIAFHPRYSTNRQFYVNYTRKSDGATVIARYLASAGNSDVADPLSGTVLLTIAQPEANHNGGAVKFGPDGYLYIGMGDGGGANDSHGTIGNAQDKSKLLGKILRIDVDNGGANPYAIPPGNPYATGVGGQREIFAIGVRNPWRISFDRLNGDFWFGDVGQGAVEEVDMLPVGTGGGTNFGWRIMEGTSCTGLASPPVPCNDSSLTPPVVTYTHSLGCSITGGYVYRGAAVPALIGQYLYADYCTGRIWAAQRNFAGTWIPSELGTTGYSISTFGEDEAGELYFANYANGDIYQFADSGSISPVLAASATVLAFGSVTLGNSSVTQTFNITNAGGGTLALATLTPGGLNPGDFTRTGTCANGTTLTASQSCTVTYQFTPAQVGARSASLAVATNGGNAGVTLAGTGTDPVPPGFAVTPNALDFGSVLIGSTSVQQTITVRNTGTATLTLAGVLVQGSHPGDFLLAGTCAPGQVLAAGATCTLDMKFRPLAAGSRTASVVLAYGAAGTSVSAVLAGIGSATAQDVVDVIEFYHAGFDHYFITSLPREIAALDSGQYNGWARTERSFKAWSVPQVATNPVCRFYIPPALGDSHFHSASPVECSDALVKFPTFVYESPAVMHEILPDAVSGACPPNSVPIYRVWNRRVDSNHRYITDQALRDAMVARGYIAEGYGPDAVEMCGPR